MKNSFLVSHVIGYSIILGALAYVLAKLGDKQSLLIMQWIGVL